MSETAHPVRLSLPGRQRRGLRVQVLAVSLALLCELLLGMVVNLDATIPASDTGAGVALAIGRAVSHGPAALGVHAVLGLLLVVGSLAAAIRGVASRSPLIAIPAVIALLCMGGASVSGATFVGSQHAAASMTMATCTALALACYAIILFALASPGDRMGEPVRVRGRSAATENAPQTGGN